MTFTRNVPISGDSLDSTRDRIRVNFQQTDTVLAVNHVGFNLSGQGKHKFLQMPEQSSAPTTAVDEAGFYSKQGSNPSEANLFFRGESDGKEYQLTRAIQASASKFAVSSSLPSPTSGSGGWTFLPGGLLLQYGYFNPNSSTSVKFPISFTSTPYSVQLTISATNDSTYRTGVSNGTLSSTGFKYEGSISSSVPRVYFVAIGV